MTADAPPKVPALPSGEGHRRTEGHTSKPERIQQTGYGQTQDLSRRAVLGLISRPGSRRLEPTLESHLETEDTLAEHPLSHPSGSKALTRMF